MRLRKKTTENLHLSRSLTNLKKSKINNDFSKLTNEQLFGLNYYYLNNLDQSIKYYRSALKSSKELPENFLTGLIHNGLALVFLKKQRFTEAKKHLDIALRIADSSKHLSLKNEVYETSEKYYTATKNIDGLVKTTEKRENVRKKLQKNVQSFADNSLTKIEQENTIVKRNNIHKNSIIGICGILIITSFFVVVIYRRRSKRDIEKFRKLLADIDHKKMSEVDYSQYHFPNKEESLKKEELAADDTFTVPEGTVKKILSKLKDFENSNAYLESIMSLPYLAGHCETNTKYLSYVIRMRKDKDFSSYINELRGYK